MTLLKPKISKKILDQKLKANRKNIKLLAISILVIVSILVLKNVLIAATVNGRPIWRSSIIKNLEKQYGSASLEDEVVRELINQEAGKHSVVVGGEEIDGKIQELANNFGGMEMLQSQLDQANFTMDELRENYRFELILSKLVPTQEVSEDEILNYYETNKDFYPEGSDFDSLKESIKEQLQNEKYGQSLQDYIEGLKDNSTINKFLYL